MSGKPVHEIFGEYLKRRYEAKIKRSSKVVQLENKVQKLQSKRNQMNEENEKKGHKITELLAEIERLRETIVYKESCNQTLDKDHRSKIYSLSKDNEYLVKTLGEKTEEISFLNEKVFHATEYITHREGEKDNLASKLKQLTEENTSLVSKNKTLEKEVQELKLELESKGSSSIPFHERIHHWIEAIEQVTSEELQVSQDEIKYLYALVRKITKQVAPEVIESGFQHDELAGLMAEIEYQTHQIQQKMLDLEKNTALSEKSKSLLMKNLETSLEKLLSLLDLG